MTRQIRVGSVAVGGGAPVSIQSMCNTPTQDVEATVEQIKRLNIPAFNFGCHGKDAHKWTERVHKEYTFRKLPYIMLKTLEKYLIQ